MKLLRISLIRVVAALITGVLLLKYHEDVLKALTIAMGVMFIIAGIVSLGGWVNTRRRKADMPVSADGQENADDNQPMFPVAGLGSLLLGLILAFTRSDDYLTWAMYLLGAVLVLGALSMIMNIMSARKIESLGVWMWLPPIAIIVASVSAMFRGLVPPDVCTTILGITALVYAVVELVCSVIFSNIRRRFEKTLPAN